MLAAMRLLVLLLLVLPLHAQPRDAVIDRVAELIVERYVYEDVARRCTAELRELHKAGKLDAADDAGFAENVTRELRRACDDQHFELVVRKTDAAPPSDPSSWLEPLRRRNYDFAEVRRLEGNVGYLDLRSFPPPDVAGTTAAGAMQFLSASDAVIVDLRENGGGTGDMVLFLATYFFERQTALSNTIRRAQGTSTQDRTLPYVPGPRLADAELFILTSAKTFSAAEAFAFSLQQLKRATIVGEVTRGGANAGRYTDVPPNFRLFVSNAHAVSAATGATWDKVGIQPDVAVPAAEALRAAHREAVKRLIAKAEGERKAELEKVLANLQ